MKVPFVATSEAHGSRIHVAQPLSHYVFWGYRRLSLLCPHPPLNKGPITLQGLCKKRGSASLGWVWRASCWGGYREVPCRGPSSYRELSRLFGGPVRTGKVLLLKTLVAEIASCLMQRPGPSTNLTNPQFPHEKVGFLIKKEKDQQELLLRIVDCYVFKM